VLSGARPKPLAVLASAGVLTSLGVLGRDRWLTRQVRLREQRMLEEFPTVAQLLALAVTTGEGPVGALETGGLRPRLHPHLWTALRATGHGSGFQEQRHRPQLLTAGVDG